MANNNNTSKKPKTLNEGRTITKPKSTSSPPKK